MRRTFGFKRDADTISLVPSIAGGSTMAAPPEEVTLSKDEILRYAESARTDHILLRVQWPGLAHEEALGNIERIGRIIAALS